MAVELVGEESWQSSNVTVKVASGSHLRSWIAKLSWLSSCLGRAW